MSTTIHIKIGDIAVSAKKPLKMSELADLLGIRKQPRVVENFVRGAVGHFNRTGQQNIAGKITGIFTDEQGNYIYNR